MPPKSSLQCNASVSLQSLEKKHTWFLPIPNPDLSIHHDNSSTWNFQDAFFPPTGLFFASVSQIGCQTIEASPGTTLLGETSRMEQAKQKKSNKKGRMKLGIKVGNPHLRRLISGAVAGALSRTAVAPLETIRTHLMVGSNGNSTTEVFQSIMSTEGWKGLFRGNFVNVIRVAPSKAIELFAFDTANKFLTPEKGEAPKLPVPPSLVAGALAGVSSTLCTYPLELIKTRLTIQREVYRNFLHAFVKIVQEEGPSELYRGLTPSLIGVIPYAATNYFAYDTLKKLYRKTFKKQEISNVATLLIGSAAGAISSTATFPLEVARKHMQAVCIPPSLYPYLVLYQYQLHLQAEQYIFHMCKHQSMYLPPPRNSSRNSELMREITKAAKDLLDLGAVGGRQVYKNMLHALLSILEKEGIEGLYKGLGPSCMKLVPAAGISFMCYEACKKILVDEEQK